MRCYNGLSDIACKRGDIETAYARARRRIEIAEQYLPEDHAWRVSASIPLANVYATDGKLAEAEAVYDKIIEEYEALLGPDLPKMALVFDSMKEACEDAGLAHKAEEYAERAAAIRAKADEASGDETPGDETEPGPEDSEAASED